MPKRARLREECLFGSLGDVRGCLDYFRSKPALNVIDKRLLLGVFQRDIEIDDPVEPTCESDNAHRSRAVERFIEANTWEARPPDQVRPRPPHPTSRMPNRRV